MGCSIFASSSLKAFSLTASILAVANYLLVDELMPAAFILLSLLGVCVDAYGWLCNVLSFAVPAAGLGFAIWTGCWIARTLAGVGRLQWAQSSAQFTVATLGFFVGACVTGALTWRTRATLVEQSSKLRDIIDVATVWLPATVGVLPVFVLAVSRASAEKLKRAPTRVD